MATLTSSTRARTAGAGAEQNYELNQSDSIDFCFNLMSDPHAHLSQTDIMDIFSSLQRRERDLPFLVSELGATDAQGVRWPAQRELRRKFDLDRARVGRSATGWFRSVPSRARVRHSLCFPPATFFAFNKFYTRLKVSVSHFQLRNLVCCGSDATRGIFYPLTYFRNSHLVPVGDTLPLAHHQHFRVNRLALDLTGLKLDCLLDSHQLLGAHSRVSTMACSDHLLAVGTFDGACVVADTRGTVVAQLALADARDGITNHICISRGALCVALNDKTVRLVDLARPSSVVYRLPFAVNCMAVNPGNRHEMVLVGDDPAAYVVDTRLFDAARGNYCARLSGHRDYGFGCDWSPSHPHCLVTGNQDGSVKLWDRRNSSASHTWDSAMGRPHACAGGPVRNAKFSRDGAYLAWAESLDHVGVVSTLALAGAGDPSQVQSIDFIGKCAGLSFGATDNGYGEELVVGVSDNPLGGILSYKMESMSKLLDFDW